MPETPASVVITCTVDGRSFSGAYALVRLPMWHKNQYSLLRSAMETWGPDVYPPQLADDLETYEARLRDLQGQELRAEVARTD